MVSNSNDEFWSHLMIFNNPLWGKSPKHTQNWGLFNTPLLQRPCSSLSCNTWTDRHLHPPHALQSVALAPQDSSSPPGNSGCQKKTSPWCWKTALRKIILKKLYMYIANSFCLRKTSTSQLWSCAKHRVYLLLGEISSWDLKTLMSKPGSDSLTRIGCVKHQAT